MAEADAADGGYCIDIGTIEGCEPDHVPKFRPCPATRPGWGGGAGGGGAGGGGAGAPPPEAYTAATGSVSARVAAAGAALRGHLEGELANRRSSRSSLPFLV